MPVNEFIKFQVTKSLLHSICVSKKGGQELEVSESICYMGTGELVLCSTLPRSQPSEAVPVPWPITSLPSEASPKKLIGTSEEPYRATHSFYAAYIIAPYKQHLYGKKNSTSSFAEIWRGALHKLLCSLLHHQVSLQTAVKMLYHATCLINFHYKSLLLYCQVFTFFWLHLSKESGKRNTYLNTTARISSRGSLILQRLCWIQVTCYCLFKMSDHRYQLPHNVVSSGQVTAVNIQQASAFNVRLELALL